MFGVAKKGSEDIKMVFDAAARFDGRCLNDCGLTGPILQKALPLVLTRFRENEIAWAADIKGMYNRVRLPPEDQRFHRFL